MSLRRITLNTAAMSSVTLLRMLVQTLIIPVLARILSPSDYGIVAMAMPFIFFAMMFADAGMGVSLVRTSDTEHSIWSTSFWLTVLIGLGLTLAVVIVGFIAASFFAEPRLGPVVAALAIVIFLQAIATIPGAALQQKHRFHTIASIEIAAMIISTAAALVTALQGGGVWALVVQQLAHYATKLFLTIYYSPFRPHAIFRLHEMREHLVFGRDFLGANFVGFLSQSIDNWAIGKMLGSAPVGIYSMAFLFARLPSRIVSGPLQLVMYPHFSQISDDSATIARLLLFLTRIITIIVFPGMAMIAVAYQPVFTIILSEKWAASGHLFLLVAPAVAVQTVIALRGTAVMALGRSDLILRQSLESGALWVIALVLSVSFGIERVAIAYDIVAFIYIPRSLALTLPLLGTPTPAYLRAMLIPTIVSMLCVTLYLAIAGLVMLGNWQLLFLAAGLATLGILASAALQMRTLLADVQLLKA